MPDHWDVRLFEADDLSGPPTIHLTDDGLFVSGKRRCSWPGGRYDRTGEPNMVLGYKDLDGLASWRYEGCGAPVPVLSTWGDPGVGTAVVFIEVVRRRGAIVDAPYGSKTLHLDLNSLPGNPQRLYQISAIGRPALWLGMDAQQGSSVIPRPVRH